MRDNSKAVRNRKVKRSELVAWLRDHEFLLKDSQIPYRDLRVTKDKFEWNDFKRKTISFEQICQIRNKNAILARYKCDNKDKRLSVPNAKPMYGIKSSIVTAVVKKYISMNRNSAYLNQKLKHMTAEFTEKEFKEKRQNKKLKSREASPIVLNLGEDPNYQYVENTSLFANPNFTTLKGSPLNLKNSSRSVYKVDGPMTYLSRRSKNKRKYTDQHSSLDIEDLILNKKIGTHRKKLSIQDVTASQFPSMTQTLLFSPKGMPLISTPATLRMKNKMLKTSPRWNTLDQNPTLNISTLPTTTVPLNSSQANRGLEDGSERDSQTIYKNTGRAILKINAYFLCTIGRESGQSQIEKSIPKQLLNIDNTRIRGLMHDLKISSF